MLRGNMSLMVSMTLWATLMGAITYSHIVYFPPYLSALPASSVVVNGPYGLSEGNFWAPIHPIVILSLLTSIALNWKQVSRRKLILTTLGIYLPVLVVSFLYFIPELGAFRESPTSNIPPSEWLARGTLWQRLSWLRGIVIYAAFVPLMLALATHPRDVGSD